VTFRLANNLRERTWSAHGTRLRDTSLGLAKRLSSQTLAVSMCDGKGPKSRPTMSESPQIMLAVVYESNENLCAS
jgi:hypothetical protein